MAALAFTPAAIRSRSITATHWIAIALAVAIPLSNSVTMVLSILLAITCLLNMDGETWSAVLKSPITIAALALVCLSIIDVSYSIANQKEITLALRKTTRLLYLPLLMPIFMQGKWRIYACTGFLAATYLSVVVAIFDGWAVFKDTIFTSLFIAYAAFMLLHFSVEYKKYRTLALLSAVLFIFYMFFLGTGRTGQLLFIMLFTLFIWQRLQLNFKQQALVLLAFCAILAAVLSVPSSFMLRQTLALQELKQYIQTDNEAAIPHSSSMGTRLVLAHNAWELVKLKPILGWGTGSFPVAYAKYAQEAQTKIVRRVNPHNQYLLTWVELGLPGLISLLFLFGSAAWVFGRSKRLEGYLGLGLVSSIVVGCIMNSWLLDFTSMFFFVFFVAVFAGADIVSPSRTV